MQRFMALSWNPAERRGETTALALAKRLRSNPKLSWHTVFSSPGALFLCSGTTTRAFQLYELSSNQGVVFGKLYRKQVDAHLQPVQGRFSEQESRDIADSGARQLVEEYWGRYVAFITAAGGEKYILRDPTGAIPCHCATVDGVHCLFSNMEDYLHLCPAELSIDWRHIAAYLHFSRVVTRDTGYQQVTQLLAGECLRINAERSSRSFYWSPAQICTEQAQEDVHQAMLQVRRAIKASVRAWGSCYHRILLELSGGLDSSVILACLAETSDVEVTCLNMYTDTPEGDERRFARRAATQAGCELIETVFSPGKSLARMLTAETLTSPTLVNLKSQSEDFRAQLATSRGVEAIFSGRGGDQLFQRRRGNFIATEYVHRHGFSPALLPIVAATARLTGNSLWRVLRAALKYRVLRQPANPYAALRAPGFIQPEITASIDAERLRHPWVCEATHLPESKSQQIFDIVDSQNYFSGSCHYADAVPALVTQPVLECVLRIPSYVLTVGGRERGLVRQAFATEVPSEILQRTTKGEVMSFYQDLIRSNLPFLREFLLDGMLVSERMLNKQRLELALSEQQLVRATQVVPLLVALRAEHWLRSVPHRDVSALRPTA